MTVVEMSDPWKLIFTVSLNCKTGDTVTGYIDHISRRVGLRIGDRAWVISEIRLLDVVEEGPLKDRIARSCLKTKEGLQEVAYFIMAGGVNMPLTRLQDVFYSDDN